jgi:CubicO group peptidase (beta-lactamase class C family)
MIFTRETLMRDHARTLSRLLPALVLVLASFLSFAARAGALDGHWEGAIELPGTKLAIDVDFATQDGTLGGDITIPAQGARDLPLAGVKQDGDKVRFAIPNIPGDPVFEGTLAADGSAIGGQFTQGGGSYPFALARRAAPAAVAASRLEGFDAWVEKTLADFEVPGLGLAIVKDGTILVAKGYGVKDRAAKTPVSDGTLFAIGSSTKAFTTLLLGQLVDQGRLEWETPVLELIPSFRLKDPALTEKLTARDLVTHRSGLPRHDLLWYNNLSLTRADAVRRLRYLDANKGLREEFQYNNLMFMTAGYLYEQLSGTTWEDGVRRQIFAPLGMASSKVTLDEAKAAPDVALPHEKRDDVLKVVPYRSEGLCMGPAGSIYSSAADMAKWVALHLGDGAFAGTRLLAPATMADMHVPRMTIASPPDPRHPEVGPGAYALGWFVDSYRGHQRVHHGGNIDGFSALVSLLPQDGIGVVALVNRGASPVPGLVAREVFDRLTGMEARDWAAEALRELKQGEALGKEAEKKKQTVRRAGTKPAHPLAEYAGAYDHPGYGRLTVALEKDRLVGRFNAIPLPLEHWHYETFNVTKDPADPTFESGKLTFRTDANGDVSGIETIFEPNVAPTLLQRAPDARLSDPAFTARLAGEYMLGDTTVTVSQRGNGLTLSVPGQPTIDLVPALGTSYTLKGLAGFTMRFEVPDKGPATALLSDQPDGLYTLKRKP